MASNGLSPKLEKWVGQFATRVENPHYLTGKSMFVDDIQCPPMYYIAFILSARHGAHKANICRGDSKDTRRGREDNCLRSGRLLRSQTVLHLPEFVAVETQLLCGEKIRHAGKPMIIVLADSPHIAEDGDEATPVEHERRKLDRLWITVRELRAYEGTIS